MQQLATKLRKQWLQCAGIKVFQQSESERLHLGSLVVEQPDQDPLELLAKDSRPGHCRPRPRVDVARQKELLKKRLAVAGMCCQALQDLPVVRGAITAGRRTCERSQFLQRRQRFTIHFFRH